MIARLRQAVEDHPWRAVCLLAAIGFAVHFVMAEGFSAPWIFADEFVYSELARNLSDGRGLVVRDQPILLTLLVPLFDAPGYLLGDTTTAFHWIHGVNAAAMTAAVFPAVGLARMALGVWPSLLFGVLVLAWPAFAYTGTVMTEPAFFAAVLLATWLLARALEQPTRQRQVLAMMGVVIALMVRLQAVVLLAAIPAICLAAALACTGCESGDRRARVFARLRRMLPLLAFSVGLPVGAVLFQLARGRSPRESLGGYQLLSGDGGDVNLIVGWTWHHIAVVALSLGIVPVALGVAAYARSMGRGFRGDGPSAVAFTVPVIVLFLLVQVSAFAALYAVRIEERNLFAIEPLLLLGAFIAIFGTGAGRITSIALALGIGITVWRLPLATLFSPAPLSDTFTLIAIEPLAGYLGVDHGELVQILAAFGVMFTIVAVGLSRKLVGQVLPVLVLAGLAWMNFELHPRLTDYSRAVGSASGATDTEWVDRAVGENRPVAFLWPGDEDPKLAWQTEFWNRSLRTVVAVDGPMPVLETAHANLNPETGRFLTADGKAPSTEEFAVAPTRWHLRGRRITSGRTVQGRLVLWRIDQPLRLALGSRGFYADGWTMPDADATAFECGRRGGEFLLQLGLGHGTRQRVVLTPEGGTPRTMTLTRVRPQTVRIHVKPTEDDNVCRLRMKVLDTATGDQLAGNGDARVLGVRAPVPRFVRSPAPRN